MPILITNHMVNLKGMEPRADPEQCCWGGARTVGGCELDGAKRRRASATKAARSACRGSCGRGLGRKNRSPRVLECT